MNILAPLKPIIFQPSAYNLTDHGAVAIVEMNILSSGKRLFLVGGVHFKGGKLPFLRRPTAPKKSSAAMNYAKGWGCL